MKYELTTLTDVIDKIPMDRIGICMKELTVMCLQAKISIDLARSLNPDAKFQFGPIIWDDDGKGEVETKHFINKQYVATTKAVV